MKQRDLDKAWADMQRAYTAWEKVPHPHSEYSEEYLRANPEILDRNGGFREKEWREYIIYRDYYLNLFKKELAH